MISMALRTETEVGLTIWRPEPNNFFAVSDGTVNYSKIYLHKFEFCFRKNIHHKVLPYANHVILKQLLLLSRTLAESSA